MSTLTPLCSSNERAEGADGVEVEAEEDVLGSGEARLVFGLGTYFIA